MRLKLGYVLALSAFLIAGSGWAATPSADRTAGLVEGAIGHLRAGRWAQRSVSLLREAIAAQPDGGQLRVALAQAEADTALTLQAAGAGDGKEIAAWITASENEIGRLVAIQPGNPGLHEISGWIYLADTHEGLGGASQSAAHKAIDEFSAAIRLQPRSAAYWRDLGDAYRLAGISLSARETAGSSPPAPPTAPAGTNRVSGQPESQQAEPLTSGPQSQSGQATQNPPPAVGAARVMSPGPAAPQAPAGQSGESPNSMTPAPATVATPEAMAIQAYTTALRLNPKDASLHLMIFHLLSASNKSAENAPALLRELDLAAPADPYNALLDYLRADLLFQRAGTLTGDAARASRSEALNWLMQGNDAPQLVWAIYQPSFPPLMAAFLAPSLGTSQSSLAEDYSRLRDLARMTVDYGREFDSSDDPDSAAVVWEAALTMGERIASDAGASEQNAGEQLVGLSAGLSIQETALAPLTNLADALGTSEQQDAIRAKQLELRSLRAYVERALSVQQSVAAE